jgi:cellulose synthase/poly-beta-1,6-N-acetylglucosamine synthase-like glycosyltransferase
MKVVSFLSLDHISDILRNPHDRISFDRKPEDVVELAELIKKASYEQDFIGQFAGGKFCVRSISAAPYDGTLESMVKANVELVERDTKLSSEPKITILTPTLFNRNDLLEKTIESVLNQSYQNWEMLIIGDGCEPNPSYKFASEKLAQELVKEDCRIVFTRTNHRGVYPLKGLDRWNIAGKDPLNFGLALANSPIVCRIDDDDVWHTNHLETIVSKYHEIKGDGVIFTQPQYDDGELVFEGEYSFNMLPQTNVTFTCTVAYCGKAIELLRYDHQCKIPGDWHTMKRMFEANIPFYKINKVTSSHRREAHSRGEIR